MTHGFDQAYWQTHWQQIDGPTSGAAPVNPYLIEAVADLEPGTALDAGCGAGVEAAWLAGHGWQVTGVDISAEVLARAARVHGPAVSWVEADLSIWTPDRPFDLVTTHYAHAAMPQLELYRRLAGWVAPGGTLLIVGHLDGGGGHRHGHSHGPEHGAGGDHVHRPGGHGSEHEHGHGHGHGHGDGLDPDAAPPPEATVTAASTAAVLDPNVWDIVTADERVRTVAGGDGSAKELHDVVVRAVRRA